MTRGVSGEVWEGSGSAPVRFREAWEVSGEVGETRGGVLGGLGRLGKFPGRSEKTQGVPGEVFSLSDDGAIL